MQANEILRSQQRNSDDIQDYLPIPLIGYKTGIKIDHSSHADQSKSFYAKTAYVGGLRQDWKQSKGYGSVFNRLRKYREAVTKAQQRQEKLRSKSKKELRKSKPKSGKLREEGLVISD